jgi:hypothetical protein
MRESYEADVIVIHHANKQKALRGSSVLFGAVDVSWELKASVRDKKADSTDKPLVMVADKLRERPSENARINIRCCKRKLVAYDGSPIIDEFGDEQDTLTIKPTKKDLERAETVKSFGLEWIAEYGQITYKEWRAGPDFVKWKKAEFDAALSFIVTFPGKWGIMRGRIPGTYLKAKAGISNSWSLIGLKKGVE